jgi:endonuclease/exonuclease/phosphatase (EEP) superfamily protein YafD
MNGCKKVSVFLCLWWLTAGAAAGAESIRVFSFNMQIFGKAKMAKPDVVNILADIVSRADVIAIQEVRTASIEPVEQFMQMLPARYAYVIGPREGRGYSKEQYWVIYDKFKVRVLAAESWGGGGDFFERNPFAVFFQSLDAFDFILINNHIQPGTAYAEINALPMVVDYFRGRWNEADVVLAGDFNADGHYYDERYLQEVFPYDQFRIVISNEYDTTLAGRDNTYDRIIITQSVVEDYTGVCGTLLFDELYRFDQYGVQPHDVSDHYPVWAEFRIGADTD